MNNKKDRFVTKHEPIFFPFKADGIIREIKDNVDNVFHMKLDGHYLGILPMASQFGETYRYIITTHPHILKQNTLEIPIDLHYPLQIKNYRDPYLHKKYENAVKVAEKIIEDPDLISKRYKASFSDTIKKGLEYILEKIF